jgi:hypothetical protein
MRRLLSILVLLPVWALAGTRILDTIKHPDGTLASGKAEISLFTPLITAGNEPIGAGRQTVTIASGVIDVTLEPNDTATPSGTSYAVRFYLSRGTYLQYWVVPTSAAALKIKDVAVSTVPTPALTIALSQLSGLGAAKGDLITFGTAWSRLPVGANGQILTADSTQPLGLKWAAGGAGGITSLNGLTAAAQTFANDTNVTIASSGSTHTLGWSGALAKSRQHAQTTYYDQAGTFTQPQTISGATTDLLTLNNSTANDWVTLTGNKSRFKVWNSGTSNLAELQALAFFGSGAGLNAGSVPASALSSLVTTVDQGYFFPVTIQAPQSSGATTAFSTNTTRVWQFVLPFAVTLNQMTFEVVATSGVGTSLGLGLYDAACASLVVNSGVMTAGGSPDINVAGVKTKAITGGPVTLNPGVYWLAMTTDSTTLTLRSTSLPSQVITMLNAQANKKFAQGGNNGSAGAFPATCGALTVAASNQPPIVLLER